MLVFRTNEVTRQKERETNSTTKIDYDRILTPKNSTFDFTSYFSGIDLKPGKVFNLFIWDTLRIQFSSRQFYNLINTEVGGFIIPIYDDTFQKRYIDTECNFILRLA